MKFFILIIDYQNYNQKIYGLTPVPKTANPDSTPFATLFTEGTGPQ